MISHMHNGCAVVGNRFVLSIIFNIRQRFVFFRCRKNSIVAFFYHIAPAYSKNAMGNFNFSPFLLLRSTLRNLCTSGTIPGPLLFGRLIDSSCILWQMTCDVTGACLLYDAPQLRYRIYGTVGVLAAFNLLLAFLLLYLIQSNHVGATGLDTKKRTDNEDGVDQDDRAKN